MPILPYSYVMVVAIAPVAIAVLAFALRLFNLGSVKTLIFDEVYYVDGARDLLRYGVEVSGAEPEFIVHPPLGKWLIAMGIKLFGDTPFGWRFVTALVGSLAILLIALIAHRLFRNPYLTALASALMSLDGLALVHSRTALLDNFLAFFILLASYLFLRKKYWLTGIALGLAMATKWSALYFLIAFGTIATYRAFTHNTGKNLIRPTLERTAQFALLPFLIYLTSWVGWFSSDKGWGRNHSDNFFASLIYYHQQMLGFHTSLTEKHPYEANPWSWLIMGRPTSFFYETPESCGATKCSQEILALGTPILWWLGSIALVIAFAFWAKEALARRFDPALTLIVTGIAAGYLPWFFYQSRTIFTFYAIIFQPFLILALIYCAQALLQRFGKKGELFIVLTVVIIFLNFIYFLPIYIGDVMTYDAWRARMWFPSWI